MNTNETVQQFATRRGFTWVEWKSLPVSRRYEESALDRGEVWTDAQRAYAQISDLPTDQRLAAMKAADAAAKAV